MKRKATWAAAAILLAFLCGSESRADSIFLQCDEKSVGASQQEIRELWEITDTLAFVDGHPVVDGNDVNAHLSISGSMIEISKEHILANSMLLMRVSIDRSTGKITVAWTDEKGEMKVRRVGTCSKVAAPAGKF